MQLLTKFKKLCGVGSEQGGQKTLRRLAHFLYMNHPTKSDVTSGEKRPRAGKIFLNAALTFSR